MEFKTPKKLGNTNSMGEKRIQMILDTKNNKKNTSVHLIHYPLSLASCDNQICSFFGNRSGIATNRPNQPLERDRAAFDPSLLFSRITKHGF
jgi:hypothetical protein